MAKSKKKSPPKRKPRPKLVYQIKITLMGSEPPIWRRFEILADIHLSTLHGVIQRVMGWENDHLHEFIIEGKSYSDERVTEQSDVKDEYRTKLNKVVQRERQKFFYEYDFGDSWEHELVIEKILPAEPDVHYPRCVEGERACPPEDCGGVWGYAEMLEAIRDTDNPEHEDRLEWLGDDFDPEAFDLDRVNGILRGCAE